MAPIFFWDEHPFTSRVFDTHGPYPNTLGFSVMSCCRRQKQSHVTSQNHRFAQPFIQSQNSWTLEFLQVLLGNADFLDNPRNIGLVYRGSYDSAYRVYQLCYFQPESPSMFHGFPPCTLASCQSSGVGAGTLLAAATGLVPGTKSLCWVMGSDTTPGSWLRTLLLPRQHCENGVNMLKGGNMGRNVRKRTSGSIRLHRSLHTSHPLLNTICLL